jgi:hypothetical protein
VQFAIDASLDGNHVLNCPNCGHEHCRVVKKGVITDIRWDQRNGPTIPVYAATISSSTYQTMNNTTWLASNIYYTSGSGGSGGGS